MLRGASARVLVVGVLLGAATCAGAGARTTPVDAAPEAGPAPEPGPTSIVQLGDSIASGEGTLYGYTYDTSTKEWSGGNLDAPWPPPYPDCHDSPDAYGEHVAASFGATFPPVRLHRRDLRVGHQRSGDLPGHDAAPG